MPDFSEPTPVLDGTWMNVRQAPVVCWSEGRFAPMVKIQRNVLPSLRQIHVRVSSELKRVLKIFCAREGVTEQAWLLDLIEGEMVKQAPDLWPPEKSSSGKMPREPAGIRGTRRTR
jgi:hypothetical protein